MKKYILVFLVLIILVIGFIIYLNINNEPEALDVEKISIEIKENTLTPNGATIIYTDKNNPPYGYSEWYKIEKKDNNEWIDVEVINNDYYFNDMAWELDKNGQFEKNIDWSNLYGTLSQGNYRLVKRVYDNEYKYIYAEFQID